MPLSTSTISLQLAVDQQQVVPSSNKTTQSNMDKKDLKLDSESDAPPSNNSSPPGGLAKGTTDHREYHGVVAGKVCFPLSGYSDQALSCTCIAY